MAFAANAVAPAPAPAPAAAQNYPSLTGRWRASGRVALRNTETGVTPGNFTCSGSLDVSAQAGSAFSGSFGTQGGGWNSDRFCTASGTLSAEWTDGSSVRAQLDRASSVAQWAMPSVFPTCQFVSGDGAWTGTATGDSISLQTKDVLLCPVNVDGGSAGIPLAQFERTITLTFERW